MVTKPTTSQSPAVLLDAVSVLRSSADAALLQSAIEMLKKADANSYLCALSMADAIFKLKLDTETLVAAVLYPAMKHELLSVDEVVAVFGLSVASLLEETVKLQLLSRLQHDETRSMLHQEKIRKMLISMVTDIRTVLIVLAERLALLRDAKNKSVVEQKKLAEETLNLYTPLANRIGVWEFKWEMEDWCLRFLEPEAYAEISEWLASKRSERETAIQDIIAELQQLLLKNNIKNAEIKGRVKHIYSIHQKQKRKSMGLERIFDASALRILVDDIDACYTVLGLLQTGYDSLSDEFKDYIAQPKSNGYQSIHMVVRDHQHRLVEIQIRTRAMHQMAELGAASHWRYKEGMNTPSSDEHKIALLRQIMAWQKELTNPSSDLPNKTDLFSDRIYVFTPQGDLIDLPVGATPIDFAYHIHSEVGHRCRGAKVNQKIVPLTTALKTGQRVEIITAKVPQPSLDWINPQLGYIKTTRARSEVQHWYRSLNLIKEKEMVDKSPSKPSVMPTRSHSDIFSAIKNKAQQVAKQITGIDSLLTKVGRCCKPLPGDAVMGYITQKSGISIHRLDCPNLKRLSDQHRERLLDVNWKAQQGQGYAVDILVLAESSTHLLRDLTGILTAEKIQIVGLTTHQQLDGQTEIKFVLLVRDMDELKSAMKTLRAEASVVEVRRL